MSSGLTRPQIEAFKPDRLLGLAAAWKEMATSIEDLFTRYNQKVAQHNGTHWTGVTANAAMDRAQADLNSAGRLADALTELAGTAEQGFWDINAPLQRTLTAISIATVELFDVDDDLTVSSMRAGPFTESVATDIKARAAAHEDLIKQGALDLFNADLGVKNRLAGARSGLIALFTSAASIGAEEGRSDGRSLAENPSGLGPVALRRLVEAGRLAPEQLNAYQAGLPVQISASQMEYINTTLRQLDGKSPAEINEIMSKLPPEARTAVGNMLQLGSSRNVQSGVVGDDEVPTHGGMAVLPAQVRKPLEAENHTAAQWVTSMPYTPVHHNLENLDENREITRLVEASDTGYRQGSDLNRGLMDVAREYLRLQEYSDQSDRTIPVNNEHGYPIQPDDRVTEDMLAALGPDKITVQAAFSDPETGKQFITDIHTHDWTDDGAAASELFKFDKLDMSIENPDDPADVAQAERIGDIMEQVARAQFSDASFKTFSAIPGSDGESVASRNPELLKTIADGMSYYISDLADVGNSPGFDYSLDEDDQSSRGFANIVALMNLDPDIGQEFNAKLLAHKSFQLETFGQDPTNSSAFQAAGIIEGVLDRGTLLATLDEHGNGDREAAYERRLASAKIAINLVTTGAGYIPVVGGGIGEATKWTSAAGLDSMLAESLVGPKPDTSVPYDAAGNTPHLDGAGEAAAYHEVLRAAGPLPEHVRAKGPDLIDPITGRIRDYGELRGIEMNGSLTAILADMLDAHSNSSHRYFDAYQKVNTNGQPR